MGLVSWTLGLLKPTAGGAQCSESGIQIQTFHHHTDISVYIRVGRSI